jgi:copper/silver efflux system protein
MLVTGIPEVELTVGKLGRVESALDPAPISMFENVINYKPEYTLNARGHRQRFRVDGKNRFITVHGDTVSQQDGQLLGLTAAKRPDPRYEWIVLPQLA